MLNQYLITSGKKPIFDMLLTLPKPGPTLPIDATEAVNAVNKS